MYMKLLRKIAVLFLMLTSVSSLNAQISPKSVDDLMAYFKNNFQNLDPIEGAYDVNIEQWGGNAYRQFPSETTNITMLIYKSLSGNFKIYRNDQITIKGIGITPAYNYNIFWEGSNVTDSKRFVLEEKSLFNVKYSIPDRQLRYDMGRNYQAGFKVNFVCSFIKTYPSYDMCVEKAEESKMDEMQLKEWTGTGFALKDGYVVTNYHVIENAKSISIQGVNGDFAKQYNATIVATDKYNDLALLQITDNSFKGFGTIPYSVKTTVSEVGEDIFVLGYPLTSTMGDEIKLTTGVISSKTGFQGDVSLYQISAPIQPGNSGGPLFDNKGNLVGIVNAKHKGVENVGYAIKTSYLKNLTESSISTSILPNNNQTAGLPLTGKVKSLKNYVFMISCSNQETNHIVSNNVSNNTNEGHQTYTQSNNYIEYPIIGSTTAEQAKIKSVRLTEEYTAIEIISNNQSGSGYYEWCNIDRNTYISANGKQYTMNKAEGIKIAPEKTYFTHAGQDITFTLYFPPLPESVKSINLIEKIDSDWKFYGIKIR